jgi:hypothetical protein
MTDILCRVCDAKTDTFLCAGCTAQLEQALAELPALLDDLDTTIARQDRGTGTSLYAMKRTRLQIPGLHYAEGETTLPATPWAFSWDAAEIAASARNTVITWARHLAETRGIDPPSLQSIRPAGLIIHRNRMHLTVETHARTSIAPVTNWLLANLDAIRLDEAAEQIHDEITHLAVAISKATDRQAPDVFAGRCDAVQITFRLDGGQLTPLAATCGVDLYGREDEPDVKCHACGMTYELAERLQEMRDRQIDNQLARAHLIANALTEIDAQLPPERLRKWIERDARAAALAPSPVGPACERCNHPTCRLIRRPLILRRGVDEDGHALYRVGDVRERVRQVEEQRSGRLVA